MNAGIARRRLARMIAADDAPEVSAEEIDDLLALASRVDRYGISVDGYTLWRSNMRVAEGDLIVAATDDGHVYEVSTPGVTGTIEPSFDTDDGATTEDNGVVFTEAGMTDWERTYDLNWAAAEGWALKANRAAKMFNFSADGASFSKEQVYAHCQERSAYYRSLAQDVGDMGSVIVGGSIGTGIYGTGIDSDVNVSVNSGT